MVDRILDYFYKTEKLLATILSDLCRISSFQFRFVFKGNPVMGIGSRSYMYHFFHVGSDSLANFQMCGK